MFTWLSTNISIDGFGGLTIFQCVNNLAYTGLCQKPTLAELAAWMSNGKLGASGGLCLLGFTIGKVRTMQIYIALSVLHSWILSHLSEEDKVDLHYDTIFLEHMLCKVARWSHLWKKHLDISKFQDETERLCRLAPNYERGVSISEAHPDALPFPYHLNIQDPESIAVISTALKACKQEDIAEFISDIFLLFL
jgi:hypothetical protein